MKKIVKRILLVLGILLVVGFLAFLYLIPPFTLAPPEAFIEPERAAYPSLDKIADPAQRAIAERGKYLVQTVGCTGCHTAGGDKGPKFETEFLAGWMKFEDPNYGTVLSRNLTPDPSTGLARRTDEQVKRVLRTGLLPEGRVCYPLFMPWADFSNFSDEDRHAIVVFLRQLTPVYHKIPDFASGSDQPVNAAFGLDYAGHRGEEK